MKKKKAYEIELNDVILYNHKPFVVSHIDSFFINDKLALKYKDTDEILPKDSKYSFYHETGLDINGIIETAIEEVPFDREFYFIGEFKPEYEVLEKERKISKTLRFKILLRDSFKCVLCGRGAENGVTLHVDHKIPFSLGGKTEENNLQTLCIDCNLGKRNKTIV